MFTSASQVPKVQIKQYDEVNMLEEINNFLCVFILPRSFRFMTGQYKDNLQNSQNYTWACEEIR